MISAFDSLRTLAFSGVLARVLIATLCGLVIGLERSAKNRPAGLRTHVLVCLAASTASLTGHYLYLVGQLPADITRMGAQVITGLGFLGAGTIIVTKSRAVKGLTTAAGLWTTGIIGLCIGSGFYEGALLGTAAVLLTQLVLSELIGHIRRDMDFRVTLRFSRKDALDQMMRTCKDRNLAIRSLQVDSLGDQEGLYHAEVQLHSSGSTRLEELLSHIRAIPGVESAEI